MIDKALIKSYIDKEEASQEAKKELLSTKQELISMLLDNNCLDIMSISFNKYRLKRLAN